MTGKIDAIAPVGAIGTTRDAVARDSVAERIATHAPPAAVTGKAPVTVPQLVATQPTPPELEAAVKQANLHLASLDRVLEYRIDRDSGLTITTIRNAQTGAVLQQFPGMNAVQFAEMLASWAAGKNVGVDLTA